MKAPIENEPSAPPDDGGQIGISNAGYLPNTPTPPRIENLEVQRSNDPSQQQQSAQPPPGYLQHQSDNSCPPPPSYSDAANYPPVYQPNTFTKPNASDDLQSSLTAYPPYPHYNSMPGGGAAPIGTAPTTTTTTVILPTGNCIHCLRGNVENETDLCCLLCLIILAVCTFPFGLAFLCCIPCTVRKRCQSCKRLNA